MSRHDPRALAMLGAAAAFAVLGLGVGRAEPCLPPPAHAQEPGADPPAPGQPGRPVVHSSPDFWKCKVCFPAYERALGYVRDKLRTAPFPAQMHAAWLLLADGRHPKDLEFCVKTALDWEQKRGAHQHAQNWYPALAGLFLAEYQKYFPKAEIKTGIEGIIAEFVRTQEITGGWFKWFEGAYKDRLDYPSKDLGMLTSIIFGFFWTAKTLGIAVPETTLERATACLDRLHSARGIAYGTPQQGGETTGARGSFILLGLDYAGQRQHEVWKTYKDLLPKLHENLPKGHHVGGLHALGVVLGSRVLGPTCYQALVNRWLDHYLQAQKPTGNVYIGDDGDAGGEVGLLQGDVASTSAFALMLLLQDPRILRPGKRPGLTRPNPHAK